MRQNTPQGFTLACVKISNNFLITVMAANWDQNSDFNQCDYYNEFGASQCGCAISTKFCFAVVERQLNYCLTYMYA